MCVVSNLGDYGRRHYPDPWDLPKPLDYWELIKKAQEYDKISKQPGCETPENKEYIRKLEERIKKLEEIGNNSLVPR